MREVAGLPTDVVSDEEMNRDAQIGALLLGMSDFSHAPPRPAKFSESLYEQGLRATQSSNIAASYGRRQTLAEMVIGWMDDTGPNAPTVGHRRWFLNPRMAKVGWGLVVDPSRQATFGTSLVFDQSRSQKVPYRFTAWPSPVAFPLEFARPNIPWSVTLNPDQFRAPDPRQVRISVTGPEGKKWDFDPSLPRSSRFESTVNLDGFGVSNCIIFLPRLGRAYQEGDAFDVTITGLFSKDGKPEKIEFRTLMFPLESRSRETLPRRTGGQQDGRSGLTR